MMLLALAVLPGLLWDQSPSTAKDLVAAGVVKIEVPAARFKAWRHVTQPQVESVDVRDAVKVPPPSVQYRMNIASATNSPWLVQNGWRFLRNPKGRFLYEVQGPRAALAAAEAFCYGAAALVHPDRDGLKPLAEMLEFLRSLGDSGPPVADFGFVDDGSPTAGEVMNLMVRENLLFRPLAKPDPSLSLTVQLGTKDFPVEDAKNPGMMAHEVRAKLTDDKRSIRIYGSQVVVARLTTLPNGVRVHLLNYAGAERKVDGLRVRVLGSYPNHRAAAAGIPNIELLDCTTDATGTEFTLPELKTYAVVDLTR